MRIRVNRRLIVLMAVLSLGLGFVAHGAMAADMGAKMSDASAEMPISHDCNACGGDDAMADPVCHGVCSSPASVLPHLMRAEVPVVGPLPSFTAPAHTDHCASPDPHPPKPVALS